MFLRFYAKEGEGKESRSVAVLSLGTEIVPRVSGKADPYHRLPAQISVIGVTEDGKKGLQVELSGAGSLDEKGEKKVDFLIRTPDIQDKSLFGMRDEYRLSYADPLLGFTVGDKSYSLSPLTEFFRYGRGAEILVHPGAFGGGAYYLETRWDQPAVRETGTFLSYKPNDLLQIKGNFLNKITEADFAHGEFQDRIYSLQGRVRPNRMLDLGLEYARSNSERERDFSDYAYRIDLKGNWSDRVWYTFEKTHAEPKFFGYYNDADYTSATLTFPIYQELRGNISYRRTEENLDLDPSKPTATRETSYRGGVSYRTPFGTNFSLDYEDFRREDRMLPADYDFTEKVVTLGVGQAFKKFTLQSYFDFGKRENRRTGAEEEHIERYSLYASFFPSRNQTYSLYARFGQERYSPDLDRSLSLGANASWRFNDKFIAFGELSEEQYQLREKTGTGQPVLHPGLYPAESTLPQRQSPLAKNERYQGGRIGIPPFLYHPPGNPGGQKERSRRPERKDIRQRKSESAAHPQCHPDRQRGRGRDKSRRRIHLPGLEARNLFSAGGAEYDRAAAGVDGKISYVG